MSVRACRSLAVLLGAVILIWQAVNAVRGLFPHPFLVPDLAVCSILLIGASRPNERSAAAWLLAGFAATAGVFLSATSAALFEGRYGAGPLATSLGLAPCLVAARLLVKYFSA